MTPAQTLQVRTALAQQIGQKAEAMRKEVEQESLRYEGALGCIKQVIDVMVAQQSTIKAAFAEQGEDHAISEAKMATVTTIIQSCQAMQDAAHTQLAAQRGKMMQAEHTLDLLEGIFAADVEAAKMLLDDVAMDAPPTQPGRHPGPSLADQRRDEAAEEVDDGESYTRS